MVVTAAHTHTPLLPSRKLTWLCFPCKTQLMLFGKAPRMCQQATPLTSYFPLTCLVTVAAAVQDLVLLWARSHAEISKGRAAELQLCAQAR